MNRIRRYKSIAKKFGVEIKIDILEESNKDRALVFYEKKPPHIILYICEEETKFSLTWLFYHELAHILFQKKFMKLAKKTIPVFTLETFCNTFATIMCGKDYGLDWFEKRTKKLRRKNA